MQEYNKESPLSIEEYGKKLVGKSFREVIENYNEAIKEEAVSYLTSKASKGSLGHLIEKYHYGYEPNSNAKPDFEEASVELKVTPYKKLQRKGYSAKERLVLNIINYETLPDEEFDDSSFWHKNKLLLLIHYLHEVDKEKLDFIIKNVQLFEFNEKDRKIIRDDYEYIRNKVKQGKAHELSEGDTNYLGAATKGAGKHSVRKQPYSNIPAMQRAFSLKTSYMTYLLKEYILKNRKTYDSKKEDSIYDDSSRLSLDDYIINKFKSYYGYSEVELIKEFQLRVNLKGKGIKYLIAAKIFNDNLNDIRKAEEIQKANISVKTIRITKKGTIKESMSFPTFKYKELIEERWEDSDLRNMFLETKFLFIVFQEKEDGSYFLSKAQFWRIPEEDLEGHVKKVWEETVKRIKNGEADKLPTKSDKEFKVSHVRPHAQNKLDTYPTPYGTEEVKKCFWLNNDYILNQINKENN